MAARAVSFTARAPAIPWRLRAVRPLRVPFYVFEGSLEVRFTGVVGYDDGGGADSCGRVEEAARMGLPEAQGVMAKCCYFGLDGIAKDRARSVEWAKKAAAGGDRLVLSMLGYAYDQGEGGLEKDWATALVWYEKAAEQGHATSMTNIGYLYGAGGFGVEKNVVTAASWYRRAALAGCAYG